MAERHGQVARHEGVEITEIGRRRRLGRKTAVDVQLDPIAALGQAVSRQNGARVAGQLEELPISIGRRIRRD
jgi:hypothetical protein